MANQYTDSYELKINLSVDGKEVDKLTKYWEEPQVMDLKIGGEYPEFINKLNAGLITTLKINVDSADLDRILSPKLQSFDSIRNRIKEIGAEIDKLSLNKATDSTARDFTDLSTFSQFGEKKLTRLYTLFKELEGLRKQAQSLDSQFVIGTVYEYDKIGQRDTISSYEKEVETIRQRLLDKYGVDPITIDNIIDTNPSQVEVPALKEKLESGLSPVSILSFDVSAEAIGALKDKVESGLNLNLVNLSDQEPTDTDTPQGSLGDSLRQSLESGLTDIGKLVVDNIQTALNNAKFTIRDVEIDPQALASPIESLDTKIQNTINKSFSLTRQIGTRLNSLGRLDGENADVQVLSNEYNELSRQLTNYRTQLQGLDRETDNDKFIALRNNIIQVEESLVLLNTRLDGLRRNQADALGLERASISANNFDSRVQSLIKRLEKLKEANTKAMRKPDISSGINGILETLYNRPADFDSVDLSELLRQTSELEARINGLGLTGKTTGEKIKAAFEKFGGWSLVTRSMTKVYTAIRKIYESVRELDTAMVNLKKVSEGTAADYDKFLTDAADRAQRLGTPITDVINSSAEFSRLGYNLEDSAKLGELATMYSKVAEDLNASDAAQSIVSTMKAFRIEAEDAVSIVDLYNYVGNNFAISSAGVGDSLQRSASSLAAANTSLEETVALTTAANEIMQDPLKVGTSLKTISARVRGAKTELEEMGESTDDLAGSTAKLQAEIKGLSGVDIMASPTQFKSIYTVFDELSQVWDNLTDIQQATIAEKLGGKNGLNTIYSLISNFQTARDVMSEAGEASGSASKELNRSLDSIEGKLGQLSATFQEFSGEALDSDVIKFFIDALNKLGQVLTKVVPLAEKLLPFVLSFSAVKIGSSVFGKIRNAFGNGGLGEPTNHWVPHNVPRILISCA